jgi:predicted TIM-barrel fold metal-dependent hydrolase
MDAFLKGGPMNGVDIVDCHVHLGPALYMQVPDSDPKGMVGALDAMGVSLACVSHTTGMLSDWKTGNDALIEARRSFPGRIWGYTFCNPRYPADIRNEILRCAASGLQGLKIHPDFHKTPADSPLYDVVYDFAMKEQRLILCHYSAASAPLAGSQLYRNVIKKFPAMRCIMAHSLPDRTAVDAAAEYFGSMDTVFFDLANAFQPGVIEYACRKLGASRLLYGSDGCWGAMESRLGLVCSADIDEKDKLRILGANMREIIAIGSLE